MASSEKGRTILQQPVPLSNYDPLPQSLHAVVMSFSGTSHQMIVHLDRCTADVHAHPVNFSFNWKTIRDLDPDMPQMSPQTARSTRIGAPSSTRQLFGRRGDIPRFVSGTQVALHDSPSAEVPSGEVDASICSVILMGDTSDSGQLCSTSWMSRSLKPVSVSFQRRSRRQAITRVHVFFKSHPLVWDL